MTSGTDKPLPALQLTLTEGERVTFTDLRPCIDKRECDISTFVTGKIKGLARIRETPGIEVADEMGRTLLIDASELAAETLSGQLSGWVMARETEQARPEPRRAPHPVAAKT